MKTTSLSELIAILQEKLDKNGDMGVAVHCTIADADGWIDQKDMVVKYSDTGENVQTLVINGGFGY